MATGFQWTRLSCNSQITKIKEMAYYFRGSLVFFGRHISLKCKQIKNCFFFGVVRGVSFTLEIKFFRVIHSFGSFSSEKRERENGPLPSLRRFSGE